ncbi:hypothetical protein ACQB60_02715 [Actinomycetota bacterium Odt1-20B]
MGIFSSPSDDDYWHCDGCKAHYLLHKGGKGLPCAWCEAHAEEGSWWR